LYEILQEMTKNDILDHRILSIHSPKAKDKSISGKPEEIFVDAAEEKFLRDIAAFSRSVHKLQRAFGKKLSITTEDLLGYAERENMMALNEVMCLSARELLTAIKNSTGLPCYISRMILQFGHLPESSVHNYVIEGATKPFAKRLNYPLDTLVGKMSHILQLEPASFCQEDSKRLTQRERLVHHHNANMFHRKAKELDSLILLLNDVNCGFLGGFERTSDRSKTVFTTYNFDGKGDIFVMATAVFPYVNSKENTYGSFSVHKRIDFYGDLRYTCTEEQLFFIYDKFMLSEKQIEVSTC